MKVRIEKDDWYPVYTIESGEPNLDVPDDVLERYKAAMEAFNEAHGEIAECVRAQWKGRVIITGIVDDQDVLKR